MTKKNDTKRNPKPKAMLMTEFFCLRMKVSVLVIDMPKPGPMLDSGQVIDAAIVMIIS